MKIMENREQLQKWIGRSVFVTLLVLLLALGLLPGTMKTARADTYNTSTFTTHTGNTINLAEGDILNVDSNEKQFTLNVNGKNVTVNICSGKALTLNAECEVNYSGFTLNMEEGSSIKADNPRTGKTHKDLILKGGNAKVNFNGNTTHEMYFNIVFCGENGELNIKENSEQQSNLIVKIQDNATTTVNVKGTMCFSPNMATYTLRIEDNSTCTMNVEGTVRAPSEVNGSGQLTVVGTNKDARMGDYDKASLFSVEAGATLKIKNITYEDTINQGNRFLYSVGKTELENVEIKNAIYNSFIEIKGQVGDSGKTERPFRFSGTLNTLETERPM